VNSKAFLANRKESTLVFIHGLISDSTCWKKQVEALSSKYNIVLYDIPGHGGRDYEKIRSIDDLVEDFSRYIGQKKLSRFVIIGHSIGSLIAQRYTLRNRNKVKALVLVSSLATGKKFRTKIPFYAGLLLSFLMPFKPLIKLIMKVTMIRSDDVELEKAIIRALKCKKNAFQDCVKAICGFDNRKNLQKIKAPTLLIMGNKDFITPANRDGKVLHKYIDSSSLIKLNTGHWIFLEKPNTVNDIISGWLLRKC